MSELLALRAELAASSLAHLLAEPLDRHFPSTWSFVRGLPRWRRTRSAPLIGEVLVPDPSVRELTALTTLVTRLRDALAEAAAERGDFPLLGRPGWASWFEERGLGWYGLQLAARFGSDYAWKDTTVVEALEWIPTKHAHKKEHARDELATRVRAELAKGLEAPLPPRGGDPAEPWGRHADALAEEQGRGIRVLGGPDLSYRVLEDPAARRLCLVSTRRDCRGEELRAWFELDPERGVSLLQASCGHDHACGHRVRACRDLAAWLSGPKGTAFTAKVCAPEWERALEDLKALREPSPVHKIVLEVGATIRARPLRADGTVVGLQQVPYYGADHRLLVNLTEGPTLLRAVARHPRVELEGRIVEVVEVPLEVQLAPSGEGVALAVRAGARAQDARGDHRRIGTVLLLPSPPDQLLWTEVEARHDRILRWAGTTFPRAAAARLVQAVDELPVRARILPGVLGEPRTWDGRLAAELSFDPRSGLTGKVRVLLPGGETVPAAVGPIRRAGADDAGAWEIVRDPAAERAAVDALWDALSLHRWHTEPGAPDSFVVPSLAEATALARALEARSDLVLTWRKPLKVKALDVQQVQISLRQTGGWFEVGGEIEGDALPLAELLAAIRERRELLVVGADQVVVLATPLFEQLERLAEVADVARGQVRVGRVHLAQLARDLPAALAESPPVEPAEVQVPGELRAELRGYQREGHAFLVRRGSWAPGAVLADDMGLGKTLQAIALMCTRGGPTLVVAPTSVLPNWSAELARFAPHLRVRRHHGPDRTKEPLVAGPGEVVVTSWDLLVRDEELLTATTWDLVVFDEAHAVKNPRTRRAAAASAIPARFRVALTGTPLENRLTELWSLLAVVVPGLLPREEQFRQRFQAPIEALHDEARLARLRALVHPFLLRRTKAEVASELPSKTELVEHVELSPPERRLYDELRASVLEQLRQKQGPRARMKVLAALTRLRQIACDARLVERGAHTVGAKVERLIELVDEFRQSGDRVLVFSEFTSLLDLCEEPLMMAGFAVLRLDGSTTVAQRERYVAEFQAGRADVFLLSRKAGGTGLNLTAATAVVHLDPWWNPAAEDQATDRAHRIGQKRPVTVVRLVARSTLEERVLLMHADKRALVASVLADANHDAPLDAEGLLALLSEEAGEA